VRPHILPGAGAVVRDVTPAPIFFDFKRRGKWVFHGSEEQMFGGQ
jgi:hypothetical protein